MESGLIIGLLLVATGAVALVYELIEQRGTPLTGKVVGNQKIVGGSGWNYRPRVQYKHPTTGELNHITPLLYRRKEWEIGSQFDLVFYQSSGKVRSAERTGIVIPLFLITVGTILTVYMWN